jgi:hypothetical protein
MKTEERINLESKLGVQNSPISDLHPQDRAAVNDHMDKVLSDNSTYSE